MIFFSAWLSADVSHLALRSDIIFHIYKPKQPLEIPSLYVWNRTFEIRTRAPLDSRSVLMVAARTHPYHVSHFPLPLLALFLPFYLIHTSSTYIRTYIQVVPPTDFFPVLFSSVFLSLSLYLSICPSRCRWTSNRPSPFPLPPPSAIFHSHVHYPPLFLYFRSRSTRLVLLLCGGATTKRQRYRMRMLNTERTFRWTAIGSYISRSSFLPRSVLPATSFGFADLSFSLFSYTYVSCSLSFYVYRSRQFNRRDE